MRPQQQLRTQPNTRQAMAVRLGTSIVVRIGAVAAFAAAIALVMSDLNVWNNGKDFYNWQVSSEEVKPGDWFVASLEIPEAADLGTFSLILDLPQETGMQFVPGSLELLSGSLEGAIVPGYSGGHQLEVKQIPAQSQPFHLEVAIQVPSDLGLLGKAIRLQPEILLEGYAVKTREAMVVIDAPVLQVDNQPVAAAGGMIGFEIQVRNPENGLDFAKIGQSFDVDISLNEEQALIREALVEVISDEAVGEIQIHGQELKVIGLSLASGQQLTVFVPVEATGTLLPKDIVARARVSANGQTLAVGRPSTGFRPEVLYDSFAGDIRGDRALLSWKVSRELNNRGFVVEYSHDGLDFVPLILIPGSDDHEDLLTYQYESEPLPRGRHIFRLRQESHDGQQTFSHQEELFVGYESTANVDVSGLNTAEWLSVSVQKGQPVRLDLADEEGRPVQTLFHGRMQALMAYDIQLDRESIAPGSYQIRFHGAHENISIPVQL